MIEAKVIADSIGQHSPRLFTIRTVYPKFLHQETLRHRRIYIEDQLRGDADFSLSVSSARAIPFKNLLQEVITRDTRAAPIVWGMEQRGMSPGPELEEQIIDNAKSIWEAAAKYAGLYAEQMASIGVHKSIVNRIIEPYIHVHALMTATEPGWMNFFGLRLDQAADPTLRALAEEIWKAWCESEPQVLQPGQWHLPFIDDVDWRQYPQDLIEGGDGYSYDQALEALLKVSAARCARLSYSTFEHPNVRSWHSKDIELHDRLVGSAPLHASPCEHQATPDILEDTYGPGGYCADCGSQTWEYSAHHGNLGPGWRQYRKMLPGESLAPLPEAYRK